MNILFFIDIVNLNIGLSLFQMCFGSHLLSNIYMKAYITLFVLIIPLAKNDITTKHCGTIATMLMRQSKPIYILTFYNDESTKSCPRVLWRPFAGETFRHSNRIGI